MQITATLSGSTATIATNQNGISTTLSITDAANLATDLAPFAVGDAPSVDTTSATHHNEPIREHNPQWFKESPQRDPRDVPPNLLTPWQRSRPVSHKMQVIARGYLLDATDDGVRITDPATNGKMTIPREQIGAVIAGLTA